MNTLQTKANNNTTPKLPGAAGEIETFAMANCLMLLSSQQNAAAAVASAVCGGGGEEEIGRSYPCKTCGRKFPSFQALGGHRASHKKIKPPSEVSGEVLNLPAKPRVHACSICGVEFPIGQALGGHMRRHRGLLGGGNGGDNGGSTVVSSVTTDGSSGNSDGSNNDNNEKKRKMINDVVVPVLKKSSSSKRVCLDLDLDLTLWIKNRDEKEEETIANDEYDDHHHVDEFEVEEGEIVESVKEDKNKIERKEDYDFLKLELRLPSC